MRSVKQSEQVLIERILNGEEKALRQFWKLFAPKLFAFIKSKVKDASDTEEILQDSLLAGLEGLRDFEGRCTLSTFLCAIARHKVIDYYRRKRVKQVVLSQLPEEILPLVSAFLGPEEEFDAQQVRERINKVFEKLRPHYRRILVMKYIEGLSVREIAEALSVTMKSAESTLYRARMAFVEVYRKL